MDRQNSIIKAEMTELEKVVDSVEQKKKERKVVHIFPHSHTDEGWLAKAEDFFTGADTAIFFGSVKDILDTTILELIANINRTFAYAELKYFKMWFERQDNVMQEKVRTLVKNGQLDLVGGGWSAPDEATTTYD